MSRFNVLQALGFQCLWFAAVLLGNRGWLVLGALILLHFIYSPRRKTDIKALTLLIPGVAVDATLTALGAFHFTETPVWLLFIWLGFILSLDHSLHWLKNLHISWQCVIGAISGTASYIAGWRLGAVQFGWHLNDMIGVIGVIWCVLLPIFLYLDSLLRRDTSCDSQFLY